MDDVQVVQLDLIAAILRGATDALGDLGAEDDGQRLDDHRDAPVGLGDANAAEVVAHAGRHFDNLLAPGVADAPLSGQGV